MIYIVSEYICFVMKNKAEDLLREFCSQKYHSIAYLHTKADLSLEHQDIHQVFSYGVANDHDIDELYRYIEDDSRLARALKSFMTLVCQHEPSLFDMLALKQ